MAKYSEFVGGKPDDITVIVARIVGQIFENIKDTNEGSLDIRQELIKEK